jgi:NADH-quinone oxidoreductase subunit H
LFFMLVRWTIPRFRFDQLMALAWKVLIPLALTNLVCVMIVKQVQSSWQLGEWCLWLLLPASLAILIGTGLVATLPPEKEPLRA